jgi:hypothetical protein
VQYDERQIVLVQAAVFATIHPTLTNEAAECGVNGHAIQPAAFALRNARAFAWSTPMKLIARTYVS